MRYNSTTSIKAVAEDVLHAKEIAKKAGKIKKNSDVKVNEDEATQCLDAFEGLYSQTIPLLRALSQGSATVLLYLDTHHNDTSAVKIADEVGLTRPRITQIIDELESDGLATRVKDSHDARKIRVIITRKGKNRVRSTRIFFLDIMKNMQVVLGSEDAQELTRLLDKAVSVFSGADPNQEGQEDQEQESE